MEQRTVNITVTGDTANLATFTQLCKLLDFLGSTEASRDIHLSYDGDGAAGLHFDFGGTDVSRVEIPNIDEEIVIYFD